jgi:hypothetical protein
VAVVHFVRTVPAADGTRVPAKGVLRFTPTARRVIPGDPDETVLPVPFQATLVEGVLDVTLAQTDASWVWRVEEFITGVHARTIHAAIPDVAELDDSDLVPIDPATLEPTAVPEPAWVAMAASTVTTGEVVGDNLVLTRTNGTTVTAGNVRGATGPAGPEGAPGAASTVPGPAGATGVTGPAGATGATGPAGTAATVDAGTTTTGTPGTSANVTAGGTPSARTFDFTIPRGDVGATGATGGQGIQGIQGIQGVKGDPAAPAMSPVSGAYAILNAGATNNATVGTVGTVYLTPAYLPAAMSITEFWAYVTTLAASSTVQIGYYTNSGSAFTKQATFGTIDTSTTGAKTLSGIWTLPAGVIWLAWLSLTAAPTLRGTSSSPMIPGPIMASSGNTVPFDDVKTLNGPTGQSSLPASFTGASFASTATPARFAAKWA